MTPDLNIIAEEISLKDLKEALKKPHKNQILVDVRPTENYQAGHIPRAVNMPLDQINQFLPELAGKDVIVSCQMGKRSPQAAEIIHAEGTCQSLREFCGGFKVWSEAKLPVEPKAKTNLGAVAGTVSHQVLDQAKHLEEEFVALSPLRQLYAILGGLMLLAAITGGVFGVLLNMIIALSLIFSALTGIMFLIDWIEKAPWNKK